MENGQARKEELQGMIDSRQKQIGEGASMEAIAIFEKEIEAFKQEIAAIEEAEQNEAAAQVRIQVQEEKVESITLPFDFNDVLSDERYINDQGQPHIITTANDMIVEVVKEFRREANDEHNKEIQALIDAHKEEIRAAGERELQLKRQNDELQQDYKELQNDFGSLEHANIDNLRELEQVKAERDDFEGKLKNAADEIDRLKSHIDDLLKEATVGARAAYKVVDINPSDRLAQLIEQSKSAKIKSAAELALERTTPFRGPVVMGVVAPPIALEAATFPNQASDTVNDMDQAEPISIPADHQEIIFRTEEVQATSDPVDIGVSGENGQGAEKTIEEAFRRIEQLELTVYGQKAEVA